MSAMGLKLVACLCMLLDHIGYCIPRLLPLRAVGRLAFPLYVFLLTEGFRHTSDRRRYALRLLVFALLAQPAFGLFCFRDPWYPEGSVMVTLLAAFLCLWLLERCRRSPVLRPLSWLCVLGVCVLLHFGIPKADYGCRGILLALTFYALPPNSEPESRREKTLRTLALLFCGVLAVFYQPILSNGIALLRYVFRGRADFAPLQGWARMQAFSLLAIPLLLLYNGRRGRTPGMRLGRKALQYAFYLFYPLHMLILYWTIRP